jgi:2-(1,2-epoxy-1,2-dihydrophenyl)acetyl-CoA isomerase
MSDEVVKTSRQGPVLVIRLASPENRNSMTKEMREQLGKAVEIAESDPSIRSVFLTADGPTFCSGGDLGMLSQQCDPWPVHRRFRNLSRWLIPLITLEKPVVVGVRGHAVGGGFGLAITGDVLIAGESARFMAGFYRLGTVPDIGVMYHLPRLIGMAQTKKFIYSGATMEPQQALALGLVTKVVSDDEVEAAGLAEAQRLAAGPAEVMGMAKALMARSFETSLTDMFAFEGFGQVLAMSNPEFREGVAALMEKRRPDFEGAAAGTLNKDPTKAPGA